MAYVDLIVKARRGIEELRNVYTIETVGVFDTAVSEAAVDALWDVYSSHWRPLATGHHEVYGIDYRNVTGAGFPTIPSRVGSLVGNSPDPNLAPGQLASLIRMQSTEPRPNRGRKYVFGIGTSHLWNDGRFSQAYVNLVQSFANQLLSGFAAVSGCTWVIARRNNQGIVTDANPVEIVSVPNRVVTQRRRVNGR